MRHYPVFLDLRDRRVVVAGGGEIALAKLRLLMKTEATLVVHAEAPADEIRAWAAEGRLVLVERAFAAGDAAGAALVYGATGDPASDAVVAEAARAAGVLVNIVDDLEGSDFITPAIVDRDPVTVAIGTEGAAPVLARKIKAEVEELLPATLGLLTRIGQGFRGRVEALDSKARRGFWTKFYFERGPRALAGGEAAARDELEAMLGEGDGPRQGFVHLVGTGPGDPELMTLKARRLLHEADVVIHDRLVPQAILELARREATILEVGKVPYGRSWKQADINALIVRHAAAGATVVRLKGGDPAVFGRLDEEVEALEAAGVGYAIVPGVTSASAAAAAIGQSLTKRGRNSSFRILTGHDVDGFAEHDWRELAKPGATAADLHGREGRDVRARAAPDARRFGRDPGDGGRECKPARPAGDRDDAARAAGGARAAAPEGPVMILCGPRAAGGGAGA